MATVRSNFHVPLPQDLHQKLRNEARRSGQPATEIAREGIRRILDERRRQAIRNEIKAYAEAMAGGRDDLDRELESASIEHLLAEEGSS